MLPTAIARANLSSFVSMVAFCLLLWVLMLLFLFSTLVTFAVFWLLLFVLIFVASVSVLVFVAAEQQSLFRLSRS